MSDYVLSCLTNNDIKNYLMNVDPPMKLLFDSVDPKVFSGIVKTPYVALIGAVIGQIISYSQAKNVRSNLYKICGTNFDINVINNLTPEQWSFIGLDNKKIDIIRNINKYLIESGNKLTTLDDINKLKNVNGIGKWTISTTILTSFLDWDTFPSGDLFIRKRIQKLYNLPKLPTISETGIISKRWSPFRTIVTWYFWRWF